MSVMDDDRAMAEILAILREQTGADFSEYRSATLERRVRNRMMSLGAPSLPEYAGRLRASRAEAEELLGRVTIKVSRFYRNAPVYDRIRREALPALASAARGLPLRMWSAGCGRGEEAYTLAMLLEEARVPGHVVASDIDRNALADARAGVYPAPAAQELPAELQERFLEAVPGKEPRVRVAAALRERVTFALDDLARVPTGGDPRYDLVCCRNVLIYFSRAAQRRVLERLMRALPEGGYLLLGEAEWPGSDALHALEVVCARQRIFQARVTREMAA